MRLFSVSRLKQEWGSVAAVTVRMATADAADWDVKLHWIFFTFFPNAFLLISILSFLGHPDAYWSKPTVSYYKFELEVSFRPMAFYKKYFSTTIHLSHST